MPLEAEASAHLGSGHSHRDVDVVAVDDLGVIDDGVDSWSVHECVSGRLEERTHEAKLDSVLLDEGVLVRLTKLDDVAVVQCGGVV